ncbi:MAG: type II toxin-antitoxin system VapC family toxin [Candidatus Freyarchaeota archaeon]
MKKEKPTYFLDSTTFIHAIDKEAEYQKECLNIINKAAKGMINTATSLEALEEVLFILSKLTSLQTAIRVTQDYLKLRKIKKYEMSQTTFEHSIKLLEITPLKRPKDAINVATMLEHNIVKIISEDEDYDKIDLVERVHPKDMKCEPPLLK